MLDALVDFLSREQAIINAHGGFLNDFPILLANCVKHSYGNYSILENCTYFDSTLMFRYAGYTKPGLDALSQEFNIAMEVRDCHSVLHDAKLLIAICKKRMDLLLKLDHLHTFRFYGILLHIKEKLPTSIWKIFNLARECSSCNELESKLYDCSKERTALNRKPVCKIAYCYFKDSYFYCKQL